MFISMTERQSFEHIENKSAFFKFSLKKCAVNILVLGIVTCKRRGSVREDQFKTVWSKAAAGMSPGRKALCGEAQHANLGAGRTEGRTEYPCHTGGCKKLPLRCTVQLTRKLVLHCEF